MPSADEPARKTVAVISVHGVGDQAPFETVRRIGDLLQDLDIGAPPSDLPPPKPCTEPGPVSPTYYPFREQPLRVNVRPVIVPPQEGESPTSGTRGPFYAWVDKKMRQGGARMGETDEMSTEFMRGQLRCYKGEDPEDTYETIRLEGSRAAQGSQPELDVHIYELYWADLSRLKAGLLSIFTELYQLLFHLSSLGTHTINAAALNHPTSTWKLFRSVQSSASVALTVPIPIVNLLMLGVTAVIVGTAGLKHAPWPAQAGFLAAIIATACAAGLGKWLWTKEISAWPWIAPVVLWTAITAGAIVWAKAHPQYNLSETTTAVESAMVALIAACALVLIIRAYNRRRPGANRWALWIAPILLAIGAALFVTVPHAGNGTTTFWLRQFEALLGALLASWAFFFVAGIGAWVLGQKAVPEVPAGPARDLARQSRWTARLLLSLPAFLVCVITLVLWGLIGMAARGFLPEMHYRPIWIQADTLKCFIQSLLEGPVEQALAIVLVLAGLAVLPAIWSLAPVAWREVFPPDAYDALRGGSSAPLGRWLTQAFFGLLISGTILYTAMMFVMPLGTAIFGALYLSQTRLQVLAALQRSQWLHALAALSGAAFAWLFAIRGTLKKLALGFRPGLDILLDVDNWLREHPLDSNPKARICGRYVSLVRYICNWQHPITKASYDKIVIIAHSQGTVISADLLRFIHAEAKGRPTGAYDPQLARLDHVPVTLFTMGCPLRQLYGMRFPYLYFWTRHLKEPLMKHWIPGDLPPVQAPDPLQLGGRTGLALWDNAYRSGDYIGRHLWRSDSCAYIWDGDPVGSPVASPVANNSTDNAVRLEFCIGAGAHTHYWDRTAPMIALELDRLIAM